MGMREYGVNEYGLVLSDETMRHLASKLCSTYSEAEYEENKYDFNEAVEYKLPCEYISTFSGDAVKIAEDGVDDWFSPGNYESYDDDMIYYIPFNRYPTLFSAAYANMREVIEEMKRKVGKYLPSDFDYMDNIRHIVGTYYG